MQWKSPPLIGFTRKGRDLLCGKLARLLLYAALRGRKLKIHDRAIPFFGCLSNNDCNTVTGAASGADDRDTLNLDPRAILEEARNLKQRGRGIVVAEIGAMNLAQRLEVGAICVAVADKNRHLHHILHRSPSSLDNGLQVLQDLFILPNDIALRYDLASGVAGGMTNPI